MRPCNVRGLFYDLILQRPNRSVECDFFYFSLRLDRVRLHRHSKHFSDVTKINEFFLLLWGKILFSINIHLFSSYLIILNVAFVHIRVPFFEILVVSVSFFVTLRRSPHSWSYLPLITGSQISTYFLVEYLIIWSHELGRWRFRMRCSVLTVGRLYEYAASNFWTARCI